MIQCQDTKQIFQFTHSHIQKQLDPQTHENMYANSSADFTSPPTQSSSFLSVSVRRISWHSDTLQPQSFSLLALSLPLSRKKKVEYSSLCLLPRQLVCPGSPRVPVKSERWMRRGKWERKGRWSCRLERFGGKREIEKKRWVGEGMMERLRHKLRARRSQVETIYSHNCLSASCEDNGGKRGLQICMLAQA